MAFDLELECKRARERIHRSIGQRWRYARAETKRMADEARALIGVPTYERKPATMRLGGHYITTPVVMGLHTGPTDGGY